MSGRVWTTEEERRYLRRLAVAAYERAVAGLPEDDLSWVNPAGVAVPDADVRTVFACACVGAALAPALLAALFGSGFGSLILPQRDLLPILAEAFPEAGPAVMGGMRGAVMGAVMGGKPWWRPRDEKGGGG